MAERLSHDAVERIVRRAIELHGDDAEPDDGIGVDVLVDAAAEIGIPSSVVLEAVAVERLGAMPGRGRLDRLVGAAVVVVERRMGRSADDALTSVDRWLVGGHHLRRERRDATSAVWRKRHDLAAGLQRGAKSFVGGAGLGDVRRIDAVVSEIDADTSVVRLLADRRAGRNAALLAGGAVAGGSLAAAGAVGVAAVGVAASVVAVPGLAVAGAVALVTKRGAAELDRELTHLLDRVAAGEESPTLVTGVARRLGLRV